MVVTKTTSQKGPLSGWDKWPEWVGQSGDWVGFVPSSYNLKIGTGVPTLYENDYYDYQSSTHRTKPIRKQ